MRCRGAGYLATAKSIGRSRDPALAHFRPLYRAGFLHNPVIRSEVSSPHFVIPTERATRASGGIYEMRGGLLNFPQACPERGRRPSRMDPSTHSLRSFPRDDTSPRSGHS